ncbi:MAG: hypothetical protein RIK87_01490 [Fuerstiella sp.]
MSQSIKTYDDTILTNLSGTLSPQAAEGILSLNFSDEQRKTMTLLAEKARAGELSEDEREQATSFERVSSLLGILQSRARVALRSAAS